MRPRDAFLVGVRLVGLMSILYSLQVVLPFFVYMWTGELEGLREHLAPQLALLGAWLVVCLFLLLRARMVTSWFYGADDPPGTATSTIALGDAFVVGRRLLGLLALLLALSPFVSFVAGLLRDRDLDRYVSHHLALGITYVAFGVTLLVGPARLGRGLVRTGRGIVRTLRGR